MYFADIFVRLLQRKQTRVVYVDRLCLSFHICVMSLDLMSFHFHSVWLFRCILRIFLVRLLRRKPTRVSISLLFKVGDIG